MLNRQIFTYVWFHIPSGKKGKTTKIFNSYEDFLDRIDNWNRMGGDQWKYWSIYEETN